MNKFLIIAKEYYQEKGWKGPFWYLLLLANRVFSVPTDNMKDLRTKLRLSDRAVLTHHINVRTDQAVQAIEQGLGTSGIEKQSRLEFAATFASPVSLDEIPPGLSGYGMGDFPDLYASMYDHFPIRPKVTPSALGLFLNTHLRNMLPVQDPVPQVDPLFQLNTDFTRALMDAPLMNDLFFFRAQFGVMGPEQDHLPYFTRMMGNKISFGRISLMREYDSDLKVWLDTISDRQISKPEKQFLEIVVWILNYQLWRETDVDCQETIDMARQIMEVPEFRSMFSSDSRRRAGYTLLKDE